MRVLVTGATGCIGRALTPLLSAQGHEVLCTVRDLADDGNTSCIPAGASAVELDLLNGASFGQLPRQCDAVVHLAQSRRYRDFPAAAHEMFEINTAATMRLVEYARKAGATRFIYTSTGSVYKPTGTPVNEQATAIPASMYAASKLAAETLLAPYQGLLNIFIPRLFYIYGPGQVAMLVVSLAQRIRDGIPVQLHGDDGIRVVPMFAGDAARVLVAALDNEWSGICNVGAQTVVSLRELAETIGRVVGRSPQFTTTDAPRPVDLLPDLGLLRQRFDLAQLTHLETGLRTTFARQGAAAV